MPVNTIKTSELLAGNVILLLSFYTSAPISFYLGYQIISHALLFTKNIPLFIVVVRLLLN